jgi:hypothetical protein
LNRVVQVVPLWGPIDGGVGTELAFLIEYNENPGWILIRSASLRLENLAASKWFGVKNGEKYCEKRVIKSLFATMNDQLVI